MRVLFVSDYPHLPYIKGGLQPTVHVLCLAIGMAGAEAAVLRFTHEYGDTEGVRLLVEPRKFTTVWAVALRRLLAGLEAFSTADARLIVARFLGLLACPSS